ncbi:MAG TPA: MOSC domain-containing protein [Solirubrobacteraceae bacterium]|jgi:MOSC domain-containing protein YiiM|nr:MOSC domain-containing protein [Solirubrobacteraceae bacterium]
MDELQTIRACLTELLGECLPGAPDDDEAVVRDQLEARGLGLAELADTAGVQWNGRFLGRRQVSRTWAVCFGIPPTVLYEPVVGAGRLDRALLLVPLEFVRPARPADPGRGVVEVIAITEEGSAAMRTVETVRAIAGRGLEGDRYAAGRGTFSPRPGSGRNVTLIAAEALEESGAALATPQDARRNLVVRGIDLDALLDRQFRVGEVRCRGRRRCEPCTHLQRLTADGVLRALVHRGGLRADVLSDGAISVGDVIEAL